MTLKKLRVRLVVDFLNSPRFIPLSSCACRTHFKCTSENSIKILSPTAVEDETAKSLKVSQEASETGGFIKDNLSSKRGPLYLEICPQNAAT